MFRLDAERALVQTVDFFPPVVDDPRWFGRIAAANALSDVYAMGGRALTALNLVCWPKEVDVSVLGEILAGGLEKVREAGAALCGGHSVVDSEIKFGLSVTGLVHPDRFWRNSGARVGDVVLLTKPLGMGPVSAAIKRGRASDEMQESAMQQMATLNKAAAEALAESNVSGCTDVTGFGLMGHGAEMARGAGVTLRLAASRLPVFSGALDLVRDGVITGAAKRGQATLAGVAVAGAGVDVDLVRLCHDAETSGGLLVTLPAAEEEVALRRLREAGATAASIGEVVAAGEHAVRLEE